MKFSICVKVKIFLNNSYLYFSCILCMKDLVKHVRYMLLFHTMIWELWKNSNIIFNKKNKEIPLKSKDLLILIGKGKVFLTIFIRFWCLLNINLIHKTFYTYIFKLKIILFFCSNFNLNFHKNFSFLLFSMEDFFIRNFSIILNENSIIYRSWYEILI